MNELEENNNLIILRGKSGSGKTLVQNIMHDVYDINTIVSYTDRTMRPGEIDGKDYHFLNPANYIAKELYHKEMNNILSSTKSNTGNRYTSLRSDIKGLCSIIVDDKGIEDILSIKDKDLGVTVVNIIGDHLGDTPEDDIRRARDKDFFYIPDISKLFDYTINNTGSKHKLHINVLNFMLQYIANTNLFYKRQDVSSVIKDDYRGT